MPKRKKRYIIGIDEVGRGALAGPVTVAAVILSKNFPIKIRVNPLLILKNKNPRLSASIKLRDSKKLSPRQRELWFEYIKTQINVDKNADKRRKNISVNQRNNQHKSAICYATASVSPKVIDRINISNAANLAATRAFNKLIRKQGIRASIHGSKVFLDGGLYLNKNSIRINQQNQYKSVSTIIKGDEKIPAIMLASIVAKVTRDRMMVKLHKKYPKYVFDRHKGYGTKKHIKAIKKYGPSPIHRKSFRLKIK